MKLNLLLMVILFTALTTVKAERGDIVAYEKIVEWTPREVVANTYNLIGGMVGGVTSDSATGAAIEKLLRTYIARNNLGRTLTFYKIRYKTIDFDDNEAIASGLIIIPKRQNGTCSYGIAVYGHGTIFGRDEVPSFYFENRKYREGELFFPIIMASMEQITLVPDYYGMGTGTGLHHHSMDKTNSNSTIDMVRAARKLGAQLGMQVNSNLALTGYSEGGSVTMSTAKRIYEEGLQSEFPNVLVCPASGAYDMSVEAYNYIVNNPYYPTRSYILYIACSCQDMYKNLFDPNDPNGIDNYLKPPYNNLYKENLPTQTGNVGWVPLPWPQMFNEGIIESVRNNENHPLRTCLKANDSYDWPNPYETFIYYCNTDEQLPPAGAVKAYNVQQSYISPDQFWNRNRIQIQELSFDGFFSDHGACAIPTMFLHFENMRSRRNIKCVRTGRYSQEDISGYADKSDAYELAISAYKEEIEVVDMNNKTFAIKKNPSNSYDLTELPEGFYMYKSAVPNEFSEWDYFIKTPFHFMRTDDYNPIQNKEDGNYFVDITRLKEKVLRVEILETSGKKIKTIAPDNLENVMLDNSLPESDYIVMVITNEDNYALKWKKEKIDSYIASKNIEMIVVGNALTITSKNNVLIENINITDIQGKLVYNELNVNISSKSIDLSVLSQGVYLATINGDVTQKIFVK